MEFLWRFWRTPRASGGGRRESVCERGDRVDFVTATLGQDRVARIVVRM